MILVALLLLWLSSCKPNFSARLLLTIVTIRHYGSHPIDLVYLIHDRTEVSIQKVADTNQRMRRMKSQGEELGEINLAIKRHLKLQIKNLQNVLRGPEKLELLLKVKSKDKRKKKKQRT
jgi:hypothetical protein